MRIVEQAILSVTTLSGFYEVGLGFWLLIKGLKAPAGRDPLSFRLYL